MTLLEPDQEKIWDYGAEEETDPSEASDPDAWFERLPINADLLLVIGAVFLAFGVSLIGAAGSDVVLLLVAVISGCVLFAIALYRLDFAVLAVVVVRPFTDQLKLASGFDTNDVLALVMLAATGLWCVGRIRNGKWVQPSRATFALLGFSAMAVVSVTAAAEPGFAIQSSVKVMAGASLLVAIEQLCADSPDGRFQWRVFHALNLSLVIPAVDSAIEWVRGAGLNGSYDQARVTGTFIHPNSFGVYLSVVLLVNLAMLVTRRGDRTVPLWSPLLASAVSGVLLILTYSRGGWIGAMVGVLVLVWKFRRNFMPAVIAAPILAVLLVPSVSARLEELTVTERIGRGDPNSFAWRLRYWQELFPQGLENPITGIGLDMVVRTNPTGLYPHNSFLQAFVETGFIGLFAFAAFCVAMAVMIHSAARNAQTARQRALAAAALAVGASYFVQMFSLNFLTFTAAYWHFFTAMVGILGFLQRPGGDGSFSGYFRLAEAPYAKQ